MEVVPELRAEAIRAMAEFGTHGYGSEASTVILEIARLYEAPVAMYDCKETNLSREERVVFQALQALLKMLAHLVQDPDGDLRLKVAEAIKAIDPSRKAEDK